MAVEVIRKLVCDVGERHDATHTLSFAVSGQGFEIDVCDKHSRSFDKDLDLWIKSGRKTGTQRKRAATGPKPAYDGEAVRQWARLTGLTVADTGRLSPTTIKKWREAGAPGAS